MQAIRKMTLHCTVEAIILMSTFMYIDRHEGGSGRCHCFLFRQLRRAMASYRMPCGLVRLEATMLVTRAPELERCEVDEFMRYAILAKESEQPRYLYGENVDT